jgi:hypothetical protein
VTGIAGGAERGTVLASAGGRTPPGRFNSMAIKILITSTPDPTDQNKSGARKTHALAL